MKKQQLYILGETLGVSKSEMDNVLKNKSTMRNLDECRISVMFSNNYKAGTTYGTISTRELYKAGTHYGTISVKDLIDLN
jgi:hypothetical protein